MFTSFSGFAVLFEHCFMAFDFIRMQEKCPWTWKKLLFRMWCPKFVGPTFGGREVWTFLYASLVAEGDDGGRQTPLFSGLWPLRTSYSTKPLLWNSLTTTLPCRRPDTTELGEKHKRYWWWLLYDPSSSWWCCSYKQSYPYTRGFGMGAIVA